MDYQSLEVVGKADDAVGPVIQRGLLQAICDQLNLTGDRGVRRGLRTRARGGHGVDLCDEPAALLGRGCVVGRLGGRSGCYRQRREMV
jgi:hypothetical protein